MQSSMTLHLIYFFSFQQIKLIIILIIIWLGCPNNALPPDAVPNPHAINVKTILNKLYFKYGPNLSDSLFAKGMKI